MEHSSETTIDGEGLLGVAHGVVVAMLGPAADGDDAGHRAVEAGPDPLERHAMGVGLEQRQQARQQRVVEGGGGSDEVDEVRHPLGVHVPELEFDGGGTVEVAASLVELAGHRRRPGDAADGRDVRGQFWRHNADRLHAGDGGFGLSRLPVGNQSQHRGQHGRIGAPRRPPEGLDLVDAPQRGGDVAVNERGLRLPQRHEPGVERVANGCSPPCIANPVLGHAVDVADLEPGDEPEPAPEELERPVVGGLGDGDDLRCLRLSLLGVIGPGDGIAVCRQRPGQHGRIVGGAGQLDRSVGQSEAPVLGRDQGLGHGQPGQHGRTKPGDTRVASAGTGEQPIGVLEERDLAVVEQANLEPREVSAEAERSPGDHGRRPDMSTQGGELLRRRRRRRRGHRRGCGSAPTRRGRRLGPPRQCPRAAPGAHPRPRCSDRLLPPTPERRWLGRRPAPPTPRRRRHRRRRRGGRRSRPLRPRPSRAPVPLGGGVREGRPRRGGRARPGATGRA